MAKPFYPKWTDWIDPKTNKRVPPGTPGAKKRQRKSKVYYARGIPGLPPRKLVRLCRNKAAAHAMLADLLRSAERRQAGYAGPELKQASRALSEHLNDYAAELNARGNTTKHVQQTKGRILRLLQGCGFKVMAELEAFKVQLYLAELRQAPEGMRPLDEAKESYTRDELAELLDVQAETVRDLVELHRLAADGEGPARTYPKATAVFLHARRCRGLAPQTLNYYLRDVKSFCTWLVDNRGLVLNPLERLESLPVETDQRRLRRALTQDEALRLLTATRASLRDYRGLQGRDRAMLYATALGTGFREGELAELLPEWFQLDGEQPALALPARHGKNKKPTLQPLNLDLAAGLRAYLVGRVVGQPIWGGSWAARGAEMLRLDLEAAGIAYIVEGPDGPLHADFHAFRHTYIAELKRAGLPVDQAMQLARHSDPRLTLKCYGRAQYAELAAAVNRLPALVGPRANVGARSPLAELPRAELEQIALGGVLLLAALGLIGGLADSRAMVAQGDPPGARQPVP